MSWNPESTDDVIGADRITPTYNVVPSRLKVLLLFPSSGGIFLRDLLKQNYVMFFMFQTALEPATTDG